MIPSPPPEGAGGPIQALWRLVHRARRSWYRQRARKLPRPVVSIGNLHWGGAGKTPLVASLATRLRDDGHRVAILSRGYGRSTRGPLVVSRGSGPEVELSEAGDEPFLLAHEVPGIAIVVAERRIDAGRLALGLTPEPELFLLDDGFSHLALSRDLDLLAIPADDPWGGGRLPPWGRLREPLESSRRADAVLVTGPAVDHTLAEEIGRDLRRFGFEGRGFSAPTREGAPRTGEGERVPPGRRVLVVTGIARPERVVDSARRSDLEVANHLAFPDHHRYPARSLARIRARAGKTGADLVLTTTKDRAKLQGRLDVPLAVLPVRAEIEPSFWDWLGGKLELALTGASP